MSPWALQAHKGHFYVINYKTEEQTEDNSETLGRIKKRNIIYIYMVSVDEIDVAVQFALRM